MSTLTLAVADYFKQEPQQAANINQKLNGLNQPKAQLLQTQLLLMLDHDRLVQGRDLLSLSAPPMLPKTSPAVAIPQKLKLSYTTSSFSKLAPDLTSWLDNHDDEVDPLTKDNDVAVKLDIGEIPDSAVAPLKESAAPKIEIKSPSAEDAFSTKTEPVVPKVEPVIDTIVAEEVSDKPRSASDTMPPLRKLKLSLKLPQLHKSSLTSLLSPKLVRFASRLENVKHFKGKDSPLAVSAQNTPLGSPSFCDFDVADYFSNNSNFTDLQLDLEDSDSDLESFFKVLQYRYKISFTNFTPPQNIYDKLLCPVHLHKAVMSADKKLMILTVMCENLAYEKNLSVKITFNNWHSTVIYNNATYVKSFSSLNFDQFKFTIPLTLLPSAINAQFCIKYSVAGSTYWDNNNSKNYSVTLTSSDKPSPKQRSKPKIPLSTFEYKPPAFSQDSHLAERPASDAFAPSKSSVPYSELVTKLMHVKMDEHKKRIPLLKSNSTSNVVSTPPPKQSLQVRPKYSRSFISRTASQDSNSGSVTSPQKTSLVKKDEPSVIPPSKTASSLPEKALETDPFTPRSVGAFHETQFNSNTYAALLRTYCFSGTPSANNSVANSPTGSESSLTSYYDCASPASTFHSLSDSIHI